MSPRIRAGLVMWITSAVCFAPPSAVAQSIGLRAIAADIDHQMMRSMLGVGLTLAVPLGTSPLRVRLGVDHLRGSADRTGQLCPFPLPCEPAPLHDESSSTAASAELVWSPLRLSSFTLGTLGSLSLMHARVRSNNLTSGHDVLDTRTLARLEAGIEASWRPWSTRPIVIELGATVGVQGPPSGGKATVGGGYPLDNDARVSRLQLGLSWSRPRF